MCTDADADSSAAPGDDEWDGDDLPSSSVFAAAASGGAGDDGGGGARLLVEQLSAKFGEVLRAAAMRAGAGIVLLLDGIELLTSDAAAALQWLPKPLPPGVRVLVGARTVPPQWRGECQVLNVPSLAPLHRALLCARRLAAVGKTLSSAQLDIIARGLVCVAGSM